MPSLDEIASWYQDDDQFEPTGIADPSEDECVRRSEDAAEAERREATFADALVALAVATPRANT
jgi:hypothetical protein